MRTYSNGANEEAALFWRLRPLLVVLIFVVLAFASPPSLGQDTDTETEPAETEETTPAPPPKPPKCEPVETIVIEVSANICPSRCQRFKKCDGAIIGSPTCVPGPCQ